MLYGHIETLEQRVDHLRLLRELQDETGGFTGFIPFAFEPEGARPELATSRTQRPSRNCATSRSAASISITSTTSPPTGSASVCRSPQLALNYGVDDLHGTIMEEKIFHMAGATTPQRQTRRRARKAIREAGREPMQRDSYYRSRSPGSPPNPSRRTELACA